MADFRTCKPGKSEPGHLTPRVTVVLPVVRGGRLFDDAVRSVLDQTLSPVELVVVVNGIATDIHLISSERVRVVRENAPGSARARNRGIASSRGEFVAFLDEDDLWQPEKLERQVALLDAEPDFVGCQTLVDRIDVNGRVLGSHTVAEVRHRDVLAGRAKYLPSSWCLRREAIVRVGSFDGAQADSEDLEFLGRLTTLGTLGLVQERLTQYRVHETSFSRRFPRRQMQAALAALNDQRRNARAAGDFFGVILGWRGYAVVRYGYTRQALTEWQRRQGRRDGQVDRRLLSLTREISDAAELPARCQVMMGEEGGCPPRLGKDPAGVVSNAVTVEPTEVRTTAGDFDRTVSARPGLAHVDRCGSGRPLVSVILPTHTGGPLFEQALASALDQDWNQLEVLVVDNGADLDRVALEGRDSRVSVLVESIPGVSVARNRALAAARGAYLAFLDHDDVWQPEKLVRQIAVLEADPTVVLGTTAALIIDIDGREVRAHPSGQLSAEGLRRFRVDYIFSSVVVRRDAAVATGGFRPDLRHAQDIDYLLRLLELGGASFIPDPLVSYRWHPASTSQPVARRHIGARECLRIAARQRDLARVRHDRRAYVDAWIGTTVVRANAARDALYLVDERWGSRDWSGSARALGSAIGFNPAVPAWLGLKALGRRLEPVVVRRLPSVRSRPVETKPVEDASPSK